jgi:murein DD-endopeptidase MepM/ murein hydrolase activator NlpD
MKILVRAFMVALVVWGAAPMAQPFIERAWLVYTLATAEPPVALPDPLASQRRSRFVDSWGNARSGGRRHQGIDIFAAKDTPVLSTTSGLVTRVGTNSLGGRVVWVLGPGLERHYYAHLNRYGDVRVGDRVEIGTIIGYAGNTGNARGGPVHLHYGIYRNGSAHNPYPRLAAGAKQAASPTVHARANGVLTAPRAMHIESLVDVVLGPVQGWIRRAVVGSSRT